MSGNPLLIQLLEALQSKDSKQLDQCVLIESADEMKSALQDLPVAKCEQWFQVLLKKLKQPNMQFQCMAWITQLCKCRSALFVNNEKFSKLLNTIYVQQFEQDELVGKLEMFIQ